MILALVVLLAASFVVFKALDVYLTSRRRARLAEQWGCKPLPLHPGGNLPFGFSTIVDFLKARDNDRITGWEQDAYVKMSPATTFLWPFPFQFDVTTIDPQNIQALLATQFKDFNVGERARGLFPFIPPGVFTNDGDAWKHSRAMLRPQFVREQVADLDAQEQHLQDLLQQIQIRPDGTTEAVNMRPLFFRQALDSSTHFLFGESCRSQLLAGRNIHNVSGPAMDTLAFSDAFDRGTAAATLRIFLGDMYWLYNPKQYRVDTKTVHDFVDYYVRSVLEAADDSTNEKAGNKYVFLHELVKETRDPIELRNQAMNILLAGRDTTSGTLGWIIHLLARHPAVYAKLRGIVLESFGTYSKPRNLDFASLKACQYLQWVMNEVLRVHPAVPGNIRHASHDTTLPVGGGPDGKSPVFVAKGQAVIYQVHIMHRRKDIWGEDADEFKPERWQGRKTGFEYLPFNGGPRICIGQQHALTNMGFTVVRLLQRFESLELLEDDGLERATVTLTTTPKACVVRWRVGSE